MMDLPSLCTLTAQPVLDRYFISGTCTELLNYPLKSTDVLFLKTDHVSHFQRWRPQSFRPSWTLRTSFLPQACWLFWDHGEQTHTSICDTLLILRIDRWLLCEFSTKKYVLFTTYFMSSFQITSTWYFQRTLWPRFDCKSSCTFGVFHIQLFHSCYTVMSQLDFDKITNQSFDIRHFLFLSGFVVRSPEL